MADFIVSPSVGDEIVKGRNRYRFDGVGWTPISRATHREGTLVVTKQTWKYKLIADQTVITGSDLSGVTLNLSFVIGAEVDIYFNGIKIKEGATEDYILTSTTVITLNETADLNDEVEIIQRSKFVDTDIYTKVESDAKHVVTASKSKALIIALG
jgi:hypothetical protein